MDNTRPSAALA